ncbi:hypothetical protein [Arthrobacter koreensis]|uniref:hypothetical protein n=1 Tax=Arthrobacter koreensis TaxID=199136 RepID=UPI002DB9ED6C|nr:hypothetical protein [Arthrobacter koreensis]MEB7505422.1 hypothetical protein [Arthrobacter koreensis]
MRRRYLLVLPATLSIGLVSCTASPEPDWEAAQAQADAFTTAASAGAGYLGGGWRAEQNEEVHGELHEEQGVTLDYASEVRIDGISVACFGDGEAGFGVMVRTESLWTGLDPITLACNSEPHTVPLAAPLERINGIRLNGFFEGGPGAVITAAVTGASE